MYVVFYVRSGDDESVIGPLTADNDVSVTEHQLLVDDNTTKPVQPKQPSGPFVYRFQLWARFALAYSLLRPVIWWCLLGMIWHDFTPLTLLGYI